MMKSIGDTVVWFPAEPFSGGGINSAISIELNFSILRLLKLLSHHMSK